MRTVGMILADLRVADARRHTGTSHWLTHDRDRAANPDCSACAQREYENLGQELVEMMLTTALAGRTRWVLERGWPDIAGQQMATRSPERSVAEENDR